MGKGLYLMSIYSSQKGHSFKIFTPIVDLWTVIKSCIWDNEISNLTNESEEGSITLAPGALKEISGDTVKYSITCQERKEH